MSIFDWFKPRGSTRPATALAEMVRFYDVPAGRVVRFPAAKVYREFTGAAERWVREVVQLAEWHANHLYAVAASGP